MLKRLLAPDPRGGPRIAWPVEIPFPRNGKEVAANSQSKSLSASPAVTL
jgi:hypothetical protein